MYMQMDESMNHDSDDSLLSECLFGPFHSRRGSFNSEWLDPLVALCRPIRAELSL